MVKVVQKRTLETRTRLVTAAEAIIAADGYGAMRVEQVVQKAGVAKGTFFAHFADKDALMERIIGARINACLDDIAKLSAPRTVEGLVSHLMPLLHLMTCERYVFDVIIRHSGAAAKEEMGPIAQTFTRQIEVVASWLDDGPFRSDVAAELLAEGVQAFCVQAIALHFCAVNSQEPMASRLTAYLEAWLNPK
ncbi:MAG: TetR/AcrR family transcriptional regulator [Hyphomicrobiales bacterium]